MAATIPFLLNFPKKESSSLTYQTKLAGGNRLKLSVGVVVLVKYWDSKKYRVRIRKEYPEGEAINRQLDSWERLILDTLNEFKTQLVNPTNDTFKKAIKGKLEALSNNINNLNPKGESITDILYALLEEKRITQRRKDHVKVVIRAFRRFELYKKQSFTLSTVIQADIAQFERFLADEHTLYATHPHIYEAVPDSKKPTKRSRNRIVLMLKALCSLFNQAKTKQLIITSPFDGYRLDQEVYGTPYYITLEERDLLYQLDVSSRPALAAQRDIFIFQCLVGCRVGDLLQLTKDSIVGGMLEYIARKTKDEKPVTVRVPLSGKATEIVNRYPEVKGNKLLPFISSQKYNEAIKEVFTLAKLTRIVTILDPQTREEVKRPLNEVASSHLARRTFIGNLYKKVQDQNLISSMSGHVEGSKAFARYRAIDDDIKRKVIESHLD